MGGLERASAKVDREGREGVFVVLARDPVLFSKALDHLGCLILVLH